MKLKKECCERFKKKGKLCKDCPKAAKLTRKRRRKLLKKHRK